MSRRKGGYYDADDFDDGYDDYDDDDYYDDYDAPAQKPAPKQAPNKKPAGKGAVKAAPKAPAKAAASAAKPTAPKLPSAPPPPFIPPGLGEPAPQKAFDFSTPSPDDKVLAAQGGRVGGSAPAATSDTTPATSQPSASAPPARPDDVAEAADVADRVAGVSLKEGASGSSRKSDSKQGAWRSPSEYSMDAKLAASAEAARGGLDKLHLAVLGHVDAGKSTLMGRLLHELGLVGDREAHKNQKEAAAAGKGSFAWAWVLDERPEERSRGVTVDVAMSRFRTERFAVTLLDAPGHRDFVPNMIAGAAQADAALLLVDGSPGGFEAGFQVAGGIGDPSGATHSGQTREHAQLARSLGIEQLAVVVNKLDVCGGAEAAQARFEHVRGELEPFLLKSGFKKAALQWLPAMAVHGENLAAAPTHEALTWWKGSTLVNAIDGFAPKARPVALPLRMPVSDVFKSRALGTGALGGKLEGGALAPGTRVMVVPGSEVGVVKALEVDGSGAQVGQAGDSVDVGLTGVEPNLLRKGVVLCHPEFPVRLVTKFTAQVIVLDVAVPILRGAAAVLHVHTATEEGAITGLLSLLDPKTGEVKKNKPRCLLKGQTAVVQVSIPRGVPLDEYKDYRALGSVALRDGGRTIAVGVVRSVDECL